MTTDYSFCGKNVANNFNVKKIGAVPDSYNK